MGMTMTQKILAAHAGLDHVEAGQLIEAKLDVVMANDITGPMALPILKQMSDTVFDKNKVVFVPDHFTPNKDIKSAENSKAIREFAKAQGLHWYFEQGKSGVEHAILPEAGVVAAGELIIGADSHTCTYGALGAFSTGVGTTDIATGMAMGELWFKVPAAIKFVLTGKPGKYVSGKDIIIHIIGKIGVDGALYKSMEFTGDGIATSVYGRSFYNGEHGNRGRCKERNLPGRRQDNPVSRMSIRRKNIQSMKPMRMQNMSRSLRSILQKSVQPLHSHIFLETQKQSMRSRLWSRSRSIRLLLDPVRMDVWKT